MKHIITGLSAEEISALVDNHVVGYKAHRNREILKAKFIDGFTFEEVAEKFDLSVPRTKTIVYEAMQKIYPHIT